TCIAVHSGQPASCETRSSQAKKTLSSLPPALRAVRKRPDLQTPIQFRWRAAAPDGTFAKSLALPFLGGTITGRVQHTASERYPRHTPAQGRSCLEKSAG